MTLRQHRRGCGRSFDVVELEAEDEVEDEVGVLIGVGVGIEDVGVDGGEDVEELLFCEPAFWLVGVDV